MPDSRATYFSSIDHASATQGYLQSAMDTHNSTVPTTPTTAGCDHNFESAVPFNGRKRFAPEALAPGCSWLTTWFLGKKCSALLQAPISIPADVRCMFQWRLFCRNASLRNSVASCETPAIPLIQTLSAPRRLSFKILICRPPNFSGCASASAIPCLMSSLCKKRFSKH